MDKYKQEILMDSALQRWNQVDLANFEVQLRSNWEAIVRVKCRKGGYGFPGGLNP